MEPAYARFPLPPANRGAGSSRTGSAAPFVEPVYWSSRGGAATACSRWSRRQCPVAAQGGAHDPVHQTLTINQELADPFRELWFAEQQAEGKVRVEILHRTIQHFKAEGKRVVVIGHSYGAFVTTRYLWRKGSAAAAPYLIMA